MDPCWSTNTKLIYSSVAKGTSNDWGLWSFNSDTNDLVQLVNQGVFYPSSNTIVDSVVYVRDYVDLYIYDSINSVVEYVLSAADYNMTRIFNPALHPDGNLVAYHTPSTGNHDYKIWIYNLLTKTLDYNIEAAAWPSFSPQGTQIVYTKCSSHNPSIPGNGYLWVYSVEDGTHTQLTRPEGGIR